MKRLFSIFVLSVFILSSFATIDAAEVTDTSADFIHSFDESDGVIAAGCTVYHDDGTVYGIKEGDGRYLENILPESTKNPVGKADLSIAVSRMSTESTTLSTNDKEAIVISFSSARRTVDGVVDVEILDVKSDQVIARAYGVSINDTFKTVYDLSDTEIKISANTNGSNINVNVTAIDDSTVMNSDMLSYNDNMSTRAPAITTTYNTTTVPKNITGNEGEFLIEHTVQGSGGNRTQYTKFVSSTGGMSTVNMAYYWEGVNLGYLMNIGKGFWVDWSLTSFPGQEIKYKMSTNSSQGTAKIYVKDAD